MAWNFGAVGIADPTGGGTVGWIGTAGSGTLRPNFPCCSARRLFSTKYKIPTSKNGHAHPPTPMAIFHNTVDFLPAGRDSFRRRCTGVPTSSTGKALSMVSLQCLHFIAVAMICSLQKGHVLVVGTGGGAVIGKTTGTGDGFCIRTGSSQRGHLTVRPASFSGAENFASQVGQVTGIGIARLPVG